MASELSLEEQREAADSALDSSIQEHVDDILGEEPEANLEPKPGDAQAAITDGAQPDGPAEVTPGPDDADRGDGRDKGGRFAKPTAKDGEATGDEPAPAPTTEAPAEPGTPAEEQYAEASYRADGQDFTIPGSAHGEEGTFIPADQWPRIQQLISSAHSYPRRDQEWQTRLEQSESRAEAAESGIAFMVDEIEKLVESGDFTTWMENTRVNWDALKAKAQLVQEKARREHAEQQVESGTSARQDQDQNAAMEQELEKEVLSRGAKYEGLDLPKVYARLHRQMRGGVFFAADSDDPSGRWKKGEILVDYALIDTELKEMHELTGAGAAAGKAATASARAVATGNAPPTVTASGTPTATDDATASRPKTREEADALMTKTARRLARGGEI